MNCLPIELLGEIFSLLDLYTLFNLSRVCLKYRDLIRTREFGILFIKNDLQHISLELNLFISIGWLDEFDFLSSSDSLFIHHRTTTASTVYTLSFSKFGIPHLNSKSLDQSISCSWDGKNCQSFIGPTLLPLDHVNECPFCKLFKIRRYENFIDKNYRVFLQTFTDFVSIKLDIGPQIHLSLVHDRSLSFQWHFHDPLKKPKTHHSSITMKRYDLKESQRKCFRLLQFFKIDGDIPNQVFQSKIKNPYSA